MKKALPGATLAGLFLVYACGADPLYLNESDAVVTIEAEGADFSQYATYYLPDRVVELCLQPEEGAPTSDAIGGAAGGAAIDPSNCDLLDHSSDEAIIASFEENMDALGYRRVEEADKDDADLALLVGMVSRSSWSLQRAYCYPNDFYSGCVEQSENPEITVPFQALVVQLIDVDQSTETDLEQVWTAGIHRNEEIDVELGSSPGGNPTITRSRVLQGAIDLAFEQSPALAEGGE